MLVIITNPDSPSAMQATGALVAASARPGERVLILSALGGAILASSQAPASPGIQVPALPAPLPPYATSFQKARHRQAIRQYQSTLLHARATLHGQQLRALAAWAKSTIAEAGSRPILQRSENVSIDADLGAAVADLSSLRQAGIGAVNAVIVIADGASVIARSAPSPLTGLQASTVVVDDFPGTTDEEFAWQASLMQSGAARAVVLTPATADQLKSVVQQGLDGAVTDTLTSVLFCPGQYKLQAAALPQLRQLLHLLTVRYPHATASINGYTDSLPVAGGNLQLSRLRAQEVEAWLVAQGVAGWRLRPSAMATPTR